MKVIVTDRDGKTITIACDSGSTLMEAIRAAGLPIDAICGGCCLCSTCHIYVDPTWLSVLPASNEDERLTLEEAIDVQPASRLACQIRLDATLDGLSVRLAPTP